MIVYYWDHASDSVKCVSHTCITSDMRKRNEQVTKFIETVLAQYYVMQQNFGFGSPMIISFWSDNCGDQFKNKYHFGWGSRYLESKELLALFVNYFAPGHGKGICDSEGGIAKHAVANAALHGEKFRSAIDLYRWLVANGGEVQSKTPLATHSPDRRQYHYFVEGAFLDYHPIDLKIDRLNCYYSFNFNRANPSTLRSRKTSCFCISCKDGNFDDCVDTSFHGRHHINQLNISDVERIPEHINLRLVMKNRMQELRTEYEWPYLVMLFENAEISNPIYAMVTPGANFNVATVHAHKLELYEPDNYHNNTKVKVPKKKKLCYRPNHNCDKLHTQLIRFDKVCCVCVSETPAGRKVSTMRLLEDIQSPDFWVYDFKDQYDNVLSQYHQTRVNVFGPYIKH